MLVEVVGELADRRRLPGAVDADDEENARLVAHRERPRLPEHRRRFLDERLGEIAGHAARLEPLDELGGGRHADVGRDQRLLEPLPGLVVGRVEGGCGELAGQRAPALAERVAQASEEAGLGGPLLVTLLVPEQGAPRRHRARGYAATASRGRRRDTIWETPSAPMVTP